MISDETWRLQPLEFSLQTIGIGNVFVCPPSCELDGKIKSCPEDFIVREILLLRNLSTSSNTDGKQLRIADISDSTTVSSEMSQQYVLDRDDLCEKLVKKTENNEESKSEIIEPIMQYETSHKQLLQSILAKCIRISKYKLEDERFYHNIEKLHQHGLESLKQPSDNDGGTFDRFVIIPPIHDDIIISLYSSDNYNNHVKYKNRSSLHKSLRLVFPLLKTSTCTEQESQEWMKLNHTILQDTSINDRCVKVEIDKTFYELIPYLHDPSRDLVNLYSFRNHGCLPVLSDSSCGKVYCHNSKNKKRKLTERCYDRNQSDSDNMNMKHKKETWLHLKPHIDRETRKEIHYVISKNCKDFTTSTIADIPVHPNSAITSAVITVQWSKKVQNTCIRKGNSKPLAAKEPDNPVITLCVIKKRNMEHMEAINHLVSTLRCRSSDIGLSGIKDMRAVTYQFCTLSNIYADQARKANAVLSKNGIQLGDFAKVNWKLNTGNHQGNDFLIRVKNVKLVEIMGHADGSRMERFIQASESDIQSAALRVYENGFVNFFGEQRVGSAGPSEIVGVRSYEIGKAMLKGDYSLAIDLLLQGRDRDVSGEFVETEKKRMIRQIWQSSQRDPNATLEAFPQNTNVMSRERTVLQGLRRYGVDKPLDALRTLSSNMRLFWITSYQSYVWNVMATERMRRFGAKVVPGDLYIDKLKNETRVVEDEAGISIFDVVLPLPGFNIIYPSHIIGNLYTDILDKDGVQFRKDAIPERTAKGTYRYLITKSECSSMKCVRNEHGSLDATFHFQLSKGSFATMFLREALGTTTAR